MHIRQVFVDENGNREEPDFFKFCPHCAHPMAEKKENEVVRKYCPSCGYIQYRNPLPGVSVLIIQNGKVLLGKRGPASFRPGTWCLPGGFIEFDEDFITAAKREVLEETGLEIEVESIINVASNFLSSRLHSLVVVFQASVKGGTLQAGDDLEALEWFPPEGDLPEMAFESDAYLIRRFAAEPISGIPAERLPG
jgi:ADP-ribose pyrophosphatase YjhB (NUDIX family)